MNADSTHKHQVQYRDGNWQVKVLNGYDASRHVRTTDIIVSSVQRGSKEHRHIVIDEAGNIIHDKWTPNH
jgi:hypothetical protein